MASGQGAAVFRPPFADNSAAGKPPLLEFDLRAHARPRTAHSKEGTSITRTWHHKILPMRHSGETGVSRFWSMKKLTLLSLIGITSIALAQAGWAAGHGGGGGGGGGGFRGGGGGFGGGRAGGFSGGPRAGGASFGRAGSNGRPGYFYSRGMNYGKGMGIANSRGTQVRSPSSGGRRSPSVGGSSRGVTSRGVTNRGAQPSQRSGRPTLNGRTDHIAERHDANSWHGDWDRRHSHFFHNRFFVFDDGFWFGLDDGFFPWDYYPYYAYDYYPYDYYPGYYADVEPYYYSEGVYSNTPVSDPTVSAVQTQLTQLGYYNGPVDGIFGQQTRDAVAKYQIDKNLDVTGSLSAQTLQSFGLPQPTAG